MAAVSEQQSRQLAEVSRQTEWEKPSFGKELFLGRFRLDLIDPHPVPSDADRERGEAFLEKLRAFLSEQVDPAEIERDAKIPDRVVKGLADLGCLGMNISEDYGGAGLSHLYYGRALALTGILALGHRHPAVGPPVDRSAGAAALVRVGGAEAQIPARGGSNKISAFLLTEPDVGSDPARMHTTAAPTEDGAAYVHQRGQAVDHQRRDRRPAGGHGRCAEVGRAPGRHQRLHRRRPRRWASPSCTATSSWACAGSRTA